MRVLLPFLALLVVLGAVLLSLWRRRVRPRPSNTIAPALPAARTTPEAQASGATATPAAATAHTAPAASIASPASAAGAATAPDGSPDAPESPAMAAARARHRLNEVAFGVQALGHVAPPEHSRLVNGVLTALEDAVNQAKYLPRRPSIVPELLRAVNDDASGRREIASIIARDPAVAADLLKIANSALYRVSDQPVESIDRAVAVLGTRGIRSLVAAAIMQPMFRAPAGQFQRFPQLSWDHAQLSGMASETIAALAEDEDPFAAQLLALLVGLGRIVVFRVALDHYGAQGELRPNPEALALLVERQSAPVGRRIAASWELSERLVTALHDQAAESVAQMSPLGRSVWLGRLLATLALLAREGRMPQQDALAVARAAGVPPRLLERMWGRLLAT
jgi:HD-like signal output (HDOD) protein